MTSEDLPGPGTRLLFENDRVRLWTLEVAPGEAYGPHEHRNAYVTVVAEGSSIASVMADGTVELEFEAEIDHVDWHEFDGPRVHTLENRGTTPYKNFIVELLPSPNR